MLRLASERPTSSNANCACGAMVTIAQVALRSCSKSYLTGSLIEEVLCYRSGINSYIGELPL